MKKTLLLLSGLSLVFLGGCSLLPEISTLHVSEHTTTNLGTGGQTSIQPTNTLSYLISNESAGAYCDGKKMDSSGYRKTITTEVVTDISTDTMTRSELAKAIVVAATTGQCQLVLQQNDLKVLGDTVSIAPIDGWAGISIIMCSCKPQIEVNLLHMSGIKKVIYN